jgi:uncharacterized DUF497 family protein
MLYIESFQIDDHILEKIEIKHNIRFEEAEEVCGSETTHVRRGKEGLYKVFGKTRAGRFILVVLVNKGEGEWKIVTARVMTDEERKLYKQSIENK